MSLHLRSLHRCGLAHETFVLLTSPGCHAIAQEILDSCLRPTRFHPALNAQSQLLAEEAVLSGQRISRLQADPDEPQGIEQKIKPGQQDIGQKVEFQHPTTGSHTPDLAVTEQSIAIGDWF